MVTDLDDQRKLKPMLQWEKPKSKPVCPAEPQEKLRLPGVKVRPMQDELKVCLRSSHIWNLREKKKKVMKNLVARWE